MPHRFEAVAGRLSQISLGEVIGNGAHGVVYRATLDGELYAAKLYEASTGRDEALAAFRREAAIHASIRHPSIPRSYEVGLLDGRPAILSELVVGQALAEPLREGPVGVDLTLCIGCQLSDALVVTHANGVVHRDLAPHNVMICADGRTVKLIDFGLARLGFAEGLQQTAGTLHYAAPEQLGLLQRPVDGRADLYSLGALLFACLTGAPPFPEADPARLLHALASLPVPSLRGLAPEADPELVALIERLLAKDPDERPATAAEVLAVLRRVHERRQGGPALSAAPALAPPPVGREAELDRLRRINAELQQGRGCAVLLTGPAGAGKSTVVGSFFDSMRAGLGVGPRLLCGTCDGSDPYPLAPLREALRAWLSGRGGETADLARADLLAAAGDRAPLLAAIDGAVATALGVTPLQTAEGRAPVLVSLARALVALTAKGRPLVLWIDDVQWLDEVSRDALTDLAAVLDQAPVLLLLSGRADGAHAAALTALRDRVAFDVQIDLLPLDARNVERMVEAALGCTPEPALVDLVVRQSEGNPLLVRQLLHTLKDSGALLPHWGRWVLNREVLGEVSLPKEIFALMRRRLTAMRPDTQAVLSAAALLGRRFALDALLAVCPTHSLQQVQQALGEARLAGLVDVDGGQLTFVHDRVREALELPRGPQRTLAHRLAADHLAAGPRVGRLVYEYARHALVGYRNADPARAAAAALAAAEAADAEQAWAVGWEMVSAVVRIGVGQLQPSDRGRLHRLAGAAAFHTQRITEARQHLRAALEVTSDPVERAHIRGAITRATIFSFDTLEGTRELERAFQELGAALPSAKMEDPNTLRPHLMGLLQQTLAQVSEAGTAGSAPPAERRRLEALISLGELGFLIGYYSRNPLFALQGGLLSVAPAHALGATPASAQGFATFAMLLGLTGQAALARGFADRALGVAAAVGDAVTLANTRSVVAIALHFCGDVDRALAMQREVFTRGADWLGPLAFQNCCIDLSWNLWVRGHSLEDAAVSKEALRRLQGSKGAFLGAYVCRASAARMAALAMRGEVIEAVALREEVEAARAVVPADRTIPWVSVAGFELSYLWSQGELGEGLAAPISDHAAFNIPAARSALHSNHFYVVLAWARLQERLVAPEAEQAAALLALEAALRDLEAVAALPTVKVHHDLVHANLDVLRGEYDAAWARLAGVERLAFDTDHRWGLCELHLARARLLSAEGKRPAALQEAQIAHAAAVREGWAPIQRRIELEYGIGRGRAAAAHSLSNGTHHAATSQELQLRAQLDGLLALSRSAAAVLDPAEQGRVALMEVVRMLGAERGLLFMLDGAGGPTLLAGRSATGDDLRDPGLYSRSLVERVAREGRPLLVSTRGEAELIGAASVLAYDLRSVVAAPLKLGERVLGVLYLDNRLARGVFGPDHLEFLSALCAHLASALQTARAAQLELALQSEGARRRMAETAGGLLSRLSASLDLDFSVRTLLDALGAELGPVQAAVLLQTAEGVELKGSRGFRRAPELSSLLDTSLRDQQRALQSHHPASLDAWPLLLPLRAQAELAGFVYVGGAQPIAPADRQVARVLVEQAGMAIENARLFQRVRTLAERDGLTGLYNRREICRLGDEAIVAAQQLDQCLSVVIFDVDHFKRFNDEHGHATGDRVLIAVAAAAAGVVRGADRVGRYGGEEFLVLLPGAREAEALLAAERMRAAVAAVAVDTDSAATVSVTISLGVAVVGAGERLEQALHRADQALYTSKGAGRDRVSLARPAGSSS